MLTFILIAKLFSFLLAIPHILLVGKVITGTHIAMLGLVAKTPAGANGNAGLMNTGGQIAASDLVAAFTAASQQQAPVVMMKSAFTMPTFMSQTYLVNSPYNASAVGFTMYAFNEDYLNTTPSNNGSGGSGGASVTRTYTDGNVNGSTALNGALISRICGAYENNAGKTCYGFDISYTNANGQLPSALSTAQIQVNYYNGDASVTPVKIDINTALRNNRYVSGELTILKKYNQSRFAQWTGFMPAATVSGNGTITAQVVFFFEPQPGQTKGRN